MIVDDYRYARKTNSRRRVAFCAAAALLLAGVCPAADSAHVTAVRFWSLGDVTRVAIEVSSEFSFKSDHLPNPDRLFFDIHGATPAMVRKGVYSVPVGDGLITQIRVAEVTPGNTRVVMDLTQQATAVTSQLTNPDRLVVEVRSKDKPGPPPSPSVTGGSKLTSPPAISEQDSAAVKALITATTKPALSPVASLIAAPAAMPSSTTTATVTRASDAGTQETKAEKVGVSERGGKKDKKSSSQRTSESTSSKSTSSKSTSTKPDPAPRSIETARSETLAVNEAIADAALSKSRSSASVASVGVADGDVPSPVSLPALVSEGDSAAPATTRRDTTPRETAAKAFTPKELGPSPLPAKRGDRTLTRALGLKLGRVVLDAGHGGHDVGTHGPSGYLEKDLALDVSQRLGALIEDGLGSEVVYTRPTDAYVGLEDRTRIANERKADLFLSIHANSSPYRSAAGVETYVLNFTTSKTALDLAARENASSQSSIFNLQELLNKIALKDKIDESREFASRLQTALSVLSSNSNESAKNRGVKRAPFVVLIGANMPSVLAEIGFLTNANDEALLRRPEHRQKIAEALYKGIAGYAATLSHFQVAKN